jgi:hypothetical protein
MSNLDDVLRSPDDAPQHPVVQWLQTRIAAGDEIRVALKVNSSPLDSSVTGLFVLRKENGVDQAPQVFDWDDDLNAAMINLGIKAVDIQQEGERFALILRAALRKVERRYGDGYMNAVLIDLIDESSLGKDGEIGRVRRLIHPNSPERSGNSYGVCRDAIALEIGGRAKELRDKLHYNPEELKTVMDKAIAQYLDERFSITSLRRLGWIDESGRTTK